MFLETAKHSGMICSNHVAEPFRQRPSREFWTQERGFNVSGNQNEDSSRERLTIKIARRWMTNFLKVINTAQKGVVFHLKKDKKRRDSKAEMQSYGIEDHCPFAIVQNWKSLPILLIVSNGTRHSLWRVSAGHVVFEIPFGESNRWMETGDDGWTRLRCNSAD